MIYIFNNFIIINTCKKNVNFQFHASKMIRFLKQITETVQINNDKPRKSIYSALIYYFI